MTRNQTNTISLTAPAAATVGSDGLTDAERTAIAMTSAHGQARTKRSRELVEAWLERKRAA